MRLALLLGALALLTGCTQLTEAQREAWRSAGRSAARVALHFVESLALQECEDFARD